MERKGSLPVREVALITLFAIVVFILIAAFNGWFNDIAGGFLGGVSYPSVK